MPERGSSEILGHIESKETEKEIPNLTAYLIRHGESETDKTNANRGLTERGREQVAINFKEIIDQIIKDELPDFDNFQDENKYRTAVQKALAQVELHLTDSGTDRTAEQAWQERQMLIELGVDPDTITMPQSAYQWALENDKIETIPKNAGPGIKKRLAGVGGMSTNPDFRKQLDDQEYQQSVGAKDMLIAWALTDEDVIPEGVETQTQMKKRLNKSLSSVERVAGKKLDQHPKRVIYVANSHASIITLAASSEFDVPIEKLGEIDNAEGIRFDFYGEGTAHTSEPLGKHTKAKIASLT